MQRYVRSKFKVGIDIQNTAARYLKDASFMVQKISTKFQWDHSTEVGGKIGLFDRPRADIAITMISFLKKFILCPSICIMDLTAPVECDVLCRPLQCF